MYGSTDVNETLPHVPFHCDTLSASYVACITFIITFTIMAIINCKTRLKYERI